MTTPQDPRNQSVNKEQDNRIVIAWTLSLLTLVAMVTAWIAFTEIKWAGIGATVLFVASVAYSAYIVRSRFKNKEGMSQLALGATTALGLIIIVVLHFLNSQYEKKWDLTKDKINTLSDQTNKAVQNLRKPLKAVIYAKGGAAQGPLKLLERYKDINPKMVSTEVVDPDKEPMRAKAANIKKYGTVQLFYGAMDDAKVAPKEFKLEEPTEEKLTNGIIKLAKDKTVTLCTITGHGEKSLNQNDAEGFETVKKGLVAQSYEIKEILLPQDKKIAEDCDAIAILGPTKAFFDVELKAIEAYLTAGGRAIIALDTDIKAADTAPELRKLLEKWYVRSPAALVIDPSARQFQTEAIIPMIMKFNKDAALTKDFQGNCLFPFSRPLEIISNAPAGLNIQWLAQTLPTAWGETSIKEMSTKGSAKYDAGTDKAGPINVALSVDGKLDSKAVKNTRIAVFGTSLFANNNFARFGNNQDLFLNSVSWVLEDESMISIRSKDTSAGRIELGNRTGSFIGILTVMVIPLLLIATGIGVWFVRRRM